MVKSFPQSYPYNLKRAKISRSQFSTDLLTTRINAVSSTFLFMWRSQERTTTDSKRNKASPSACPVTVTIATLSRVSVNNQSPCPPYTHCGPPPTRSPSPKPCTSSSRKTAFVLRHRASFLGTSTPTRAAPISGSRSDLRRDPPFRK